MCLAEGLAHRFARFAPFIPHNLKVMPLALHSGYALLDNFLVVEMGNTDPLIVFNFSLPSFMLALVASSKGPRILASGVQKSPCTSSQEWFGHVSLLCAQRQLVDSLKWAIMGIFTPQRLANVINHSSPCQRAGW